VPFDEAGAPVEVQLQNSAGQVLVSFNGTIELVLRTAADGPTDAVLSHATAKAVRGVATFDRLSIDRSGHFAIRATTASIPASGWPLSSPFTIVDDACVLNDTCRASFAQGGTTLMDVAFTNSVGGLLTLATGIDPGPDCTFGGTFADPFFHTAATWTVDQPTTAASGILTAQVRISKAYRKMVEDRGNTSYRVCGAVEAAPDADPNAPPYTPWDDSPIQLVDGEWVFLFPDCTSTITKFCMVAVKSTKAGDIIQTVATGTAAGDPKHR
jgi:hypothetical protein